MSTAIAIPRATTVVDARGFRLRHITPTATWPSEGGTATLLGRTYGFTELPMSHLPESPDLVEGSYTGRLGDAGEFSLSFPNVASSKGLWRERFDPDLCLEFIEIYRDDALPDFVGSIQRVEIDRGVVTVSGMDAWSLLRRAYEQDRSWTAAPQEVITAYTRVPLPVVVDDFDGAALSGDWTTANVTTSVSDGAVKITRTANPAYIRQPVSLGNAWRLEVVVRPVSGDGGPYVIIGDASQIGIQVRLDPGGATIGMSNVAASPTYSGAEVPTGTKLTSGPVTLVIERLGRWVRGFLDGVPLGYVEASPVSFGYLTLLTAGTVGATMTVESVTLVNLAGFLARGSDVGSYVLPTDQPIGGLHGRYFDMADQQGSNAAIRRARTLEPDREPYGERLDATIDTAAITIPMQPGNSGDYFAVRWFGSSYLRGDLGNYTFEVTSVLDGVRLWVGKTAFADALIDDWTTAAGTDTATWTAANYGSSAGWYPIVLEYFCDTGTPAITLKFTPPGTTYTDPGGTSITASTKRTIPATSLSPLGCFDNRVQGTSHFDLVQKTAQQFGYQLWCEPMQLESGEFPGRLVPRLRVGRDTAEVLEVEDTDGVEPALSPGLTRDGSDQATTLIGAGAGLADGKGSQVSAEIHDIASMEAALFDLQGTVDAADIAFADLLAARLAAELALRATPWEEVRATPRAQEKLSDTWPLTGALAAMRWRPGDGLRLVVPDISVEDTEPRQMLQVTRSFAAEGRTGTQVAFRQRPRSATTSVRALLYAAIASQRSYQGQRVTLPAAFVNANGATIAAGGFTDYAMAALLPGDRVVSAVVRVVANTGAVSLGVEINGTDRTTALGGGWTVLPLDIPITAYATQAGTTDNRLFVRLQNNGGVGSVIQYQLVVEVLR